MLDTFPEASKRRGAARAKLSDASRPPNICIESFGSDSGFCRISHRQSGDRELARGKEETLGDFKQRVQDSMPINGWPAFAIFFPREDPAVTAEPRHVPAAH